MIKMSLKGISVLSEDATSVNVMAKAGEDWSEFVEYCNEREWAGIENLIAIPGTVGTAPVSNI